MQTIKGGLYAIFSQKGSYNGLMDLYYNIFIKWLPHSEYELNGGGCFEKFKIDPFRPYKSGSEAQAGKSY